MFFANLTVNLLPFCRSRCRRRRRCLNSLLPLDNGQFFQQPMKKSRMVIKFDPYGALVINRGNRILIVIHLYCCSEYKINCLRYLSRMLCILSLCIIYDWITIMEYNKNELSSAINMLYSLPPHNGHFLLSPRWPLWRGSTVLCNLVE